MSFIIKSIFFVIICILSYKVYNGFYILSNEEAIALTQYIADQATYIEKLKRESLCI